MPSSLSWFLGISVVAVAAIGMMLSLPPPDLKWDTVVLPAAREYMEQSMNVAVEDDDDDFSHLRPLRGLVVAVTGSTSGIGLGVTGKLSLLGATIIALGRSPQKLQQLQYELLSLHPNNKNKENNKTIVDTVLADFSDLESIAKASQYILEHYDHVDVLVNNAGIHTGLQGAFENKVSKQGYDLTFAVNYLSHFLLTEQLMPLLQRSRHPKVVHVSSRFHGAVDGSDLSISGGGADKDAPIASQVGGSHGFGLFRSQRQYGNSKMAQILHARSLQRHYPNLRAVSVCPTWVGTQILGSEEGSFSHSLFESTAFPSDGFGLSSLLHAILDTSDDKNDDFYINSFGNGGKPQQSLSIDVLPAWTYQWIPLRDTLVGSAAFTILFVGQRFTATREVGRSTLQTYDEELQEELYTWSRKAVSPWL